MARKMLQKEFLTARYQALSLRAREALHFIRAECSRAGVWEANLNLLQYMINPAALGDDDARAAVAELGDRIEEIKPGVYWLTEFCKEQYGQLSYETHFHKPILDELCQEGLLVRVTKQYVAVSIAPAYTRKIKEPLTQPEAKNIPDVKEVMDAYLKFVKPCRNMHIAARYIAQRMGIQVGKNKNMKQISKQHLLLAIHRYADECEANGTERPYRMKSATFFLQGYCEHYSDMYFKPIHIPTKPGGLNFGPRATGDIPAFPGDSGEFNFGNGGIDTNAKTKSAKSTAPNDGGGAQARGQAEGLAPTNAR